MTRPPDDVLSRALAFVHDEAGFAQVTTIDVNGYPVARTATAFLDEDWSVSLVQRASHARLAQLRRNPRLLVAWVGDPAPGATNERPHVFDLGRLPPRAVLVRGTAVAADDDWTERTYLAHVLEQRASGNDRAPLRSPAQVATDLTGLRVLPHRVRLEGFGDGAQAFDWVVGPPTTSDPTHHGGRP